MFGDHFNDTNSPPPSFMLTKLSKLTKLMYMKRSYRLTWTGDLENAQQLLKL